ncbi:MAG: ABC transporter ATP-binding protein, partial [Candidatus Wildermuthbacteria bacterium]|nr:ABC transporter ATP-binding protein [Candidatus Wildermuthbacteria bacterium]
FFTFVPPTNQAGGTRYMRQELALEVKNLAKDFNGFLAVDNISFEIGKGEILGLLGPNGAGKTTTIMMLLGITKPTSGNIKMFGLDFEKNREKILNRINFSSAYTHLSERITVIENLYVFSYLYGVGKPQLKIKKLLEKFELTDLKGKIVRDLSSGQTTRLNLCKAFLNDPELLFLDEPTSSLDPDIAEKVRDFLLEAKKEKNMSILYSSHNMEEITRMCDRVIFLDHGEIVASDTPLNLTKVIQDVFLTLTFDAPLAKVRKICLNKKLDFKISQSNTLELNLKEAEIGAILTQLANGGVLITNISIKNPTLEDVFLKIVRH